MFVAVGAVGVVGVVAAANHSDYSYSDYSDYSRHSQHSQYGDSYLVNQINAMQSKVSRQENEVSYYRNQVKEKFAARLADLRRKENYSALNSVENLSPNALLSNIKQEMQREIEENIQRERNELERIDKMIDRINELEMKAGVKS